MAFGGFWGAAVRRAWFVAMGLGGFCFGLVADRRPFGDGLLAHPLVLFFLTAALGLMALRVLLRRPVPEAIPDRALVGGCIVGIALFLAGNFVATHVLPGN